MADIFDNIVLCKQCNKKMKKMVMEKEGFPLRILYCEKCKEKIIHPSDLEEYKKFSQLKSKQFDVKLRMVGNSYAISIPKEIVEFIKEQEKIINNVVRLSFENTKRLSLFFGNIPKENKRIIKSREIKIEKNGKIFHAKQFYDSAHPEKNKIKIIESKE
ncbi:MAG: hypothetical protein QW117_00200 [Candidatus Pacearchaeota archaeon]